MLEGWMFHVRCYLFNVLCFVFQARIGFDTYLKVIDY